VFFDCGDNRLRLRKNHAAREAPKTPERPGRAFEGSPD
jgi:hypothetical protein